MSDVERYSDREKRLAYLKEYRERPENKERKRAYMRDRYQDPYWRERMKEQSNASKDRWKTELKPIINEALANGCSRCTESDKRCLQFHHRDASQKVFGIGAYLSHIRVGKDPSFVKRKKMLIDEISKCDVLCANCHFKEHNAISDY